MSATGAQAQTPEITISGGGSVREDVAAEFTVTANPAPMMDLQVNLNVTTSGGDNVPTDHTGAKTLTIPTGESSVTYPVPTPGNATDQPVTDVTVTIEPVAEGYTVGSANAATIRVEDVDPTVVSLLRTGTGAIAEGQAAQFTVRLGRALVADEIIDVPLAIGGTGVTTDDWSLSAVRGTGLGVTLRDAGTATPVVRFAAGEGVAVLSLLAELDGTAEGGGAGAETFEVALGADSAFDDSGLGTNVGGGADPDASAAATGFKVRVTDAARSMPTLKVDIPSAVSEADGGEFPAVLTLSSPLDKEVSFILSAVRCSAAIPCPQGVPAADVGLNKQDNKEVYYSHDFRFEPNQTRSSDSSQLTVNDTEVESTEAFAVRIVSALTGVTIDPSTPPDGTHFRLPYWIVRIHDDDNPANPNVSIAPGGSPVAEGADTSFTVTAQPAPTSPVTVTVSVRETGDVAVAGQTGTRQVTLPAAGSASAGQATFTVGTEDDAVEDLRGAIVATVEPGTGYTVGARAATVRVTDDDGVPVEVTLEAGTGAASHLVEGDSADTATVTVTLGRALVAGEIAEVPLTLSSATGAALPPGSSAPDVEIVGVTGAGASYLGTVGAELRVRFLGSGAQSAVLTFRATARDDMEGEDDSFTVGLGDLSGGSLSTNVNGGLVAGAGRETATLDIRDRVLTSVRLSAPVGHIDEDEGGKTLTLRLGRALTESERLDVGLLFSGSATRGTDYRVVARPSPGVVFSGFGTDGTPVVSFLGGGNGRVATLELLAHSDLIDETSPFGGGTFRGETVQVALAPVAAGASTSGVVNFRIHESTVPDVPLLEFTTAASTLAEGVAGVVRPRIDGSGLLVETDVAWRSSGSAGADDAVHDFALNSTGTLQMLREADGVFSVAMMAAQDDGMDEPPETVVLAIEPGTGYRVSARSVHVVTLVDNDPTPVMLAAGADTTLVEGDTRSTGAVVITLARALAAGEVAVVPLALSSSTGVALPGSATPDVTLEVSGRGATLVDAASATPAVRLEGPGARAARLVFRATDRDDGDGDPDHVDVGFGDLSTSVPGSHLGGGLVAAPGVQSARIRLADTMLPEVSFASPVSQIAEFAGARTATVSVELSAPAEADTVVAFTLSGTAAAEVDYTAPSPATVTIAKGTLGAEVTVEARDDRLDELPETAVLALAPGAGYRVGAARRHTVTIFDDDPVHVTLSGSTDDVAENAGTKALNVTLSNALVADEALTVGLVLGGAASRADGDYTLAGVAADGVAFAGLGAGETPTVTFTGPDAPAQATFVLTAHPDNHSDTETVTVALDPLDANSGTNLVGGATSVGRVSFFIANNLVARVQWRGATSRLVEGGGGTARAALGVPGGGVTPYDLDVALAVGGRADSADFVLEGAEDRGDAGRFVRLRRAAGGDATVTVAVRDDALDEPNETVTLTIAPDPSEPVKRYRSQAPTVHTVTLVDDDPTEVTLVPGADTTLTEGDATDTATVVLELSRALINGEALEVPLVLSSATGLALPGTGAPEVALSASGRGVTLARVNTATPRVRFRGGGAQRAVVTFKPVAWRQDADAADETLTVALGAPPPRHATHHTVGGGTVHAGARAVTLAVTDTVAEASFTAAASTVTEGAKAPLALMLSSPPPGRMRLQYTISGTARLANQTEPDLKPHATDRYFNRRTGGDFPARTDFTLDTAQDTLDEPDETVVLTLKPRAQFVTETRPLQVTGTRDYRLHPEGVHTVTIRDDDPTVVGVLLTGSRDSQEGTPEAFTVSLGRALVAGEALDVPIVLGSTQTPLSSAEWFLGLDSGATNTGVSLARGRGDRIVRFEGAGARVASLILEAIPDGQEEVQNSQVECISVRTAATADGRIPVAGRTNVAGGAVQNTANKGTTVCFADSDQITAAFSGDASPSLTENGSVDLTVELSKPAPTNTTVEYTVSGTAVSGTHFAALPASNSVTVKQGDTTATITVTAPEDAVDRPPAELVIDLVKNSAAAPGKVRRAVVTIEDNDATTLAGKPGTDGMLDEGDASDTATGAWVLSRPLAAGERVDVDLHLASTEPTVRWPTQPGGGDFTVAVSGTGVTPRGAASVVTRGGASVYRIPVRLAGTGAREAVVTFRAGATPDADRVDNTVEIGATPLPTSNLHGGVELAADSTSPAIRILDTPEVAFAAPAQAVSEAPGGAAAGVVLALRAPAPRDVTLEYQVSGSDARAGEDYEVSPGSTVAVAAGARTVEIPLTVLDDLFDEPPETVEFRLLAGTGYQLGEPTLHRVVLVDDDATQVTLTAPGGDVDENEGSKVLTVTLGRALAAGEALSVPLAFAGSATRGVDYRLHAAAANGVAWSGLDAGGAPVVRFTGGAGAARRATLTVTALADAVAEADETVTVAPGTVAGTGLDGGAAATGSVSFALTDRAAPALPVVGLAPVSATLIEGSGNGKSLRIDGSALTAATEVTYAVSGSAGAADAAYNFTLDTTTTVSVPAGGHHDLVITAAGSTDDAVDEPPETVTVALQPGAGYRLGADTVFIATLRDNDPTEVTLAAGTDVRMREGDVADIAEATVTLGRALVAGEVIEVPLVLSSTTGLALPGTAGAAVAVAARGTGVTLRNAGTAAPVVRLEGPAARVATLTVRATAVEDGEGLDDSLDIGLGTLSDPALATRVDGGVRGSGSASLTLADASAPFARFVSAEDVVLTEGEANQQTSAAVVLSTAVAADTRVAYATSGTAGADDVSVPADSMLIRAGDRQGVVAFEVLADTDDEPDETLRFTLLAGPGNALGEPHVHNVTLIDDDPTEISVEAKPLGLLRTDTTIQEGDTSNTAQLVVALGRKLAAGEVLEVPLVLSSATGVALPGTSAPEIELVGATGAGVTLRDADTAAPVVRFEGSGSTPGAGRAEAELTFRATSRDDGDSDDEWVTVALGDLDDPGLELEHGGGGRVAGSSSSIRLTIDDTVLPELGFTRAASRASEASGERSALFTLTLSEPQPHAFAARLSLRTEGGEIAVQNVDFVLEPPPGESSDRLIAANSASPVVVFRSGETSATVVVRVIDDALDEAGEGTVSLELVVAGHITYRLGAITEHRVTIIDDDPTPVTFGFFSTVIGEPPHRLVELITTTWNFKVELGRALVEGETLAVPLAFSGTALREVDYRIRPTSDVSARVPAQPGVSYSGFAVGGAPTVTFTGGPGASAIGRLSMGSILDDLSEPTETLRLGLGTLDAASGTGLGGGAVGTGSIEYTVVDSEPVVVNWAGASATPAITKGYTLTEGVAQRLSSGALPEVRLGQSAGPAVTAAVAVSGTAVLGVDYGPSPTVAEAGRDPEGLFLTTLAGAFSDFKLAEMAPAHDDDVDEPTETAVFTIVPDPLRHTATQLEQESRYKPGANAVFTVTIRDNDPTTVTLSAPAGAVSERTGEKQLTLALGRSLTAGEALDVPLLFTGVTELGVDYRLDGMAAAGVSYHGLLTAPVVRFTGGPGASATAVLRLRALADTEAEPAESVVVDLGPLGATSGTGLDGGAAGTGSVAFSITDSPPGAVVEFTDASSVLVEGRRGRVVPMLDGAGATYAVRAGVSLALDGASAGEDYESTHAPGALGLFDVTPGRRTALAPISLGAAEDDAVDEPRERVRFTLDAGTDYRLGARSEHVVVLVDDDPTVVTLSAPPGDLLERNVLAPCPDGVRPFCFNRKDVTVTLGRPLVAGEALTVPLVFGGTATGPGGGDYSIETDPRAGVTYGRFANGTLGITFTGGPGASDTAVLGLVPEPELTPVTEGIETVTVRLGALAAQGLDGGAVGGGTVRFGIYESAEDRVLSLFASETVVEGAAAEVGVVLSEALSAPLAVPLRYLPGTASGPDGLDYIPVGEVVIPAGEQRATVAVPTLSDARDEPVEQFTVEFPDTLPAGLRHGAARTATVRIIDSNPTPVSLAAASRGSGRGRGGEDGDGDARAPASARRSADRSAAARGHGHPGRRLPACRGRGLDRARRRGAGGDLHRRAGHGGDRDAGSDPAHGRGDGRGPRDGDGGPGRARRPGPRRRGGRDGPRGLPSARGGGPHGVAGRGFGPARRRRRRDPHRDPVAGQ